MLVDIVERISAQLAVEDRLDRDQLHWMEFDKPVAGLVAAAVAEALAVEAVASSFWVDTNLPAEVAAAFEKVDVHRRR